MKFREQITKELIRLKAVQNQPVSFPDPVDKADISARIDLLEGILSESSITSSRWFWFFCGFCAAFAMMLPIMVIAQFVK